MHQFYLEGEGLMPIISIIVPVYNAEKYISRCLDSIIAQTFTDFELILVNDGSEDISGDICEIYADKDKRVKVIHKTNGGPGEARNYGLDIAKGKYIGFVDSDDIIDTTMYEKLLGAIINDVDEIKLSMCGRFDLYENIKRQVFTLRNVEKWSSEEAIKNLLTWKNIDSSPCDKLFHRSLFDAYRFPENTNVEDIYIMYKILSITRKIVHLGEPLYYYIHRPDSRSVQMFSSERLDILKVVTEIRKFVSESYPTLIEEAESFYYTNVMFLYKILSPKQVRSKYQSSYEEIYGIIRKNTISIIRNKYINTRIKIKTVLIFLKLYDSFMSISKQSARY